MDPKFAGILSDIRIVFDGYASSPEPVVLDLTERDVLNLAKSLRYLTSTFDNNIEEWEGFPAVERCVSRDLEFTEALKIIQEVLAGLR